MKRFASIADSLGFLALCDIPETFFEKKSNLMNNFLFLMFSADLIGFQLFTPVFEPFAYPFGYFLALQK